MFLRLCMFGTLCTAGYVGTSVCVHVNTVCTCVCESPEMYACVLPCVLVLFIYSPPLKAFVLLGYSVQNTDVNQLFVLVCVCVCVCMIATCFMCVFWSSTTCLCVHFSYECVCVWITSKPSDEILSFLSAWRQHEHMSMATSHKSRGKATKEWNKKRERRKRRRKRRRRSKGQGQDVRETEKILMHAWQEDVLFLYLYRSSQKKHVPK